MPQEDYILRELEKLNTLLALIFNLRKKGNLYDSSMMAKETFKEYFDADLIELSKPDSSFFSERINTLSNPRIIELLAKTVYEVAINSDMNGDPSAAQNLRKKALLLYYLLNEKDKTFSFEREILITELENEFK